VRVDLVDARVRQAERDELADAVVGDIPADGAGGLGQQLHDAQVGQRVDLEAAQLAWDDQAIEAAGMEPLDQRFRQSLLLLDLVVIPADDRAQRGGTLHERLSVDIGR
jgi:hypothetical protein